jgi:tetratricopeptide (TPR) repeat protein
MARLVLITLIFFLTFVLVGCSGVDTGRAQIVPSPAVTVSGPTVDLTKTTEADLAEQMAANRQAYHRGLEVLVQHYTKTGNNMKLTWAQKELDALDEIPQYNYVVEATVAGPNLRASKGISEADYLYNDAVRLEEQAGQFVVVKNDNLLRLALDKYNQLISKFPGSDKIDDAAFHAAGIYEHFKDYTIAVLYYQRTYQWDPQTNYPARFKAAQILDKYLGRRAEALQLYQEALDEITRSGQHPQWQQYAEQRTKELAGEVKPKPLGPEPMSHLN